MSPAARLAFAAVVLLAAGNASADAGEWALGPQVTVQVPVAGRVGAAARVGLDDWGSLEARFGLGYDREEVSTNALLGVVIAWDVLALVPELALAGGARFDRYGREPQIAADVGLRHHFGMRSSLGLALGGEWGPKSGWSAAARMTLWLSIF